MIKVVILFGEMGVGKNFVGELVAQHLGLKFIDGDHMLPKDLEQKVNNFEPLLKPEVDRFVKKYIVPQTVLLAHTHGGIVLAQALYLKEHRDYIKKSLISLGFECKFIYVKTHSIREHLSRLLSRRRGFRWALYGMLNKPFFQKPDPSALTINNSGTKEQLLDRISYYDL